MLEKELQNKCIKYLKSKGIYYINKYGDGRTAKGCSDLIICVNGRFVSVELKTKKGVTSDIQIMHGERIRKSGGLFYIINDFETFKGIINEIHNTKEQKSNL